MQKVLVVGGSGFLGSHIVSCLLRIEHERKINSIDSTEAGNISEIRILDLAEFDVSILKLNFTPKECGVEVRSLIGSITSLDDLRSAMDDVTEVYQCCSIVDFHARSHIPKRLMDVNVVGNHNVLDIAIRSNVKRLIYTSTVVCLP